jgi:hypothetical protein
MGYVMRYSPGDGCKDKVTVDIAYTNNIRNTAAGILAFDAQVSTQSAVTQAEGLEMELEYRAVKAKEDLELQLDLEWEADR